MNGLLRKYLPKGRDLSFYMQAQLDAVARRLKERTKKALHYETPTQALHQFVASIG
jgi:IS30 family transposase